MNDEITNLDFGSDLDLHHFHPKDAKYVLHEFINSSIKKRIKTVRIAHGKGTSQLKALVIKELENNPNIESFSDDGSNWGATIAKLHMRE